MKFRHIAVIGMLLISSGCASMERPGWSAVEDPNQRVDELLSEYQALLASGKSCHNASKAWSDASNCDGLLREAMQLYASYPNNGRIRMLSAAMFYQVGKPEQSAYLLDQILVLRQPRPEAAILRSRIAMEQGNLSLARRILSEQISLNPMHPQLHETMASVHYLNRDYDDSFNALIRSEQLGAPGWRVAYHRGLVFERRGKLEVACQQYISALSQNPQYIAPKNRLIGLSHIEMCYQLKTALAG